MGSDFCRCSRCSHNICSWDGDALEMVMGQREWLGRSEKSRWWLLQYEQSSAPFYAHLHNNVCKKRQGQNCTVAEVMLDFFFRTCPMAVSKNELHTSGCLFPLICTLCWVCNILECKLAAQTCCRFIFQLQGFHYPDYEASLFILKQLFKAYPQIEVKRQKGTAPFDICQLKS